MHKKILIIYATAGTGHKKAAYAIKTALDQTNKNDNVDIIDSLDYTNTFFKWSYPRFYIFMVNRIPKLWGLGYYLLDNRFIYTISCWIRHLVNWINSRPLARFLRDGDYDVIISTHFLAHDVISMEGKKKIRAHLINVITDFRSHSFWIAGGVDTYVVAHQNTKEDLISKYGIRPEMIEVLGIPIDPVFAKKKDKKSLLSKLGLNGELFTVLVGSGGFGVGPIVELVKSFKQVNLPMQLIVVCGKNESLKCDIESLKGEIETPVIVYGYVNNMDELMEVADCIVTKTGGMMSSEALSKDLPIVAIAPIPGQETRNFEILIRSGVALEVKDIAKASDVVVKLYEDKDMARTIAEKIKRIKRGDSAYKIAELALR